MLEKKVNERTPFFIEPDCVRRAGVAQSLVTMKVASIQAVEEVPKPVRVRPILVGNKLQVQRIVKPQIVNRTLAIADSSLIPNCARPMTFIIRGWRFSWPKELNISLSKEKPLQKFHVLQPLEAGQTQFANLLAVTILEWLPENNRCRSACRAFGALLREK